MGKSSLAMQKAIDEHVGDFETRQFAKKSLIDERGDDALYIPATHFYAQISLDGESGSLYRVLLRAYKRRHKIRKIKPEHESKILSDLALCMRKHALPKSDYKLK